MEGTSIGDVQAARGRVGSAAAFFLDAFVPDFRFHRLVGVDRRPFLRRSPHLHLETASAQSRMQADSSRDRRRRDSARCWRGRYAINGDNDDSG